MGSESVDAILESDFSEDVSHPDGSGPFRSDFPELPLRRYVGEIRLSDRALERSNQRASRWFERPQNRSDFRRAPRELCEHPEARA